MSICHTVIPDISEGEQGEEIIRYQASSPDELALIEGANTFGYEFVNRSMNTISIKVFQRQSEDWNVFFEFPFDSTRKRMSLIVKSQNSEDYLLLTKGADSIMIPRLLIDKAELKILEKMH